MDVNCHALPADNLAVTTLNDIPASNLIAEVSIPVITSQRDAHLCSPTNDLVHIWAKRSSSGGISFMDFHRNKFNFLVTTI